MRAVSREWLGLGAAMLAVGLMLGTLLYRDRQEIDALERERLRGQAAVVAENLGRQFEGLHSALAGVRDELPNWDRNKLAQLAAPRLKALNDALPGVRSIHIVDVDGRVLATSRDIATVGRSFADRDLYSVPKQRPDAATLYVSAPYTSRRENLFAVNVGRVLTDTAGNFAGVVTAALDPEYFEVLLRSVLYASDMRTALLHGNGMLFLYAPAMQQGLGGDRSQRASSPFNRHRESGRIESVQIATSSSSGDVRMTALRTIRHSSVPMDHALVVAVSREVAAIYRPWWRDVALLGGLFLLFCAAVSLGLTLDQRRRRALGRAALAQAAERYQNAERMELALAGAELGLWDWTVAGAEVIFNERWFTMLGYGAGEFEASFDTWRLLLHPQDAQRAQGVIDTHLRGETPAYEFEHRLRHKDGRWIWILSRGKVVQRDAAGAPLRMVGTHMDITARKAADAALSESNAFAQQVIDNLPHGFAVRDAELRYLRFNLALTALTGLPQSAVLGRTTAEVLPDLPAALLESLTHALQRALAGEVVVTADRRIEQSDSVQWTSTIHGPLRDAAGTIVGTLSSVLDITARKHVEQQLQRSEEGLAITLQSIADAVIATDAQGRVTRINSSAEQLTGWTSAQACGQPLTAVFRIVNAQTRQPADDPVQRVLQHGEVVGLAHPTALIARDGAEHQIADSAAPIRNAAGQIEGVVLVFSDVTEKYRVQQALQESEERFRAIVESSPMGIFLVGPDGGVTYGNAADRRLTGLSEKDTLGLRWIKAIHPDDRERVLADWQASAARGEDYAGSGRYLHDDGTVVWWDMRTAAIRVGERLLGHVGMVVDTTAHTLAEQDKASLEAQLRESQKMQAIGTLAGGIAHDFNNILGAILGNAAIALEDVGRDHPAARNLEQINRAGRRARALVRQILAFSRRQPQELVTQPLGPVVEEALALMRSTLPAMVALNADLPDQPLHGHIDATQIEQLLMNLCTNAWHAMQGSTGQITVGLERVELDEASATRLGLSAGAPYARLSVRDNGIGMDKATLARIFEPFYTTKPLGKGTGLGLSVVHGIVGAHKGAIAVDSEPGQGTTFHVYLPLVMPPALIDGPAAEALLAPRGDGQHVLYVDDDDTMTLIVERSLQRLGYRVTTFDDAARAVAAVRAQPDNFALVVTDFNMPAMTGLDVARALIAVRPSLPIIISSGYITDDLRAQAKRAGVRRLLEKQFTIELLAGMVQEVLAETQH